MNKKFLFACCPAITRFPLLNRHKVFLFARLGTYGEETKAALSVGPDQFTCKTTFNFEYENAFSTNLCFSIRQSHSEVDLARLTLPLRWFEIDTVVRYPFPMKVNEPRAPVFMHVEIHLCENREGAFLARPGRLTVAPTWGVPMPPGIAQQPPVGFPAAPVQYPFAGWPQGIPQSPQIACAPIQFPHQAPQFGGLPTQFPPQFAGSPPQFSPGDPQFTGQPPIQYIAVRPQYLVDPRTGQYVWSYAVPGAGEYQIPARSPDTPSIEEGGEGITANDADYIPRIEE